MAKAEIPVIEALWRSASLLEESSTYQWGHMGKCNCGFLAQVVTGQSADEIHAAAMKGHGDWSEQLIDYCPSSGRAMDEVIGKLLTIGFDHSDLAQLERLSDPEVLNSVIHGARLIHNRREDVILYLRTWAALLEAKWITDQPDPLWAGLIADATEVEKECSLSPRFPG